MRILNLKFKNNLTKEQVNVIEQLSEVAEILYALSKDIHIEENISCDHPKEVDCIHCKDVKFYMDNLLEASNILEEERPDKYKFIGHGEFGIVLALKSNPQICMKLYSSGDYKQDMMRVYESQLLENNPLYPTVFCVKNDEFVIMEYVEGYEFTQLEFYEWVAYNNEYVLTMLDNFFNRLFKDYSKGILVEDLHIGNLKFLKDSIKIIDLDTYIKSKIGEPNTYTLSDFSFCYSPYDDESELPTTEEDYRNTMTKIKAQDILEVILKKNLIKHNLKYKELSDVTSNISTDPLT